MSKKPTALQVAVVGGGIGGLTAALALRAHGVGATVFEKTHELREVGAGLLIKENGVRALESIGAGSVAQDLSTPVPAASIRTWRGEPFPVSSNPSTWYPVHRAELQQALAAKLPEECLLLGKALVNLCESDAGVALEFSDGSTHRADVVIGADGIHSVAQGFVAPPVSPVSEGTAAYRGLIPAERLAGIAGLTGLPQAWVGPGHNFLLFPVSRGALFYMAAIVPTDFDVEESWSSSGDIAALAALYAGWEQPVLDVIGAMDQVFRWGLYDRPQPERWSTDRITLLGDAAHATTPHLGQGANQAIEDAVTLGVLLEDVSLADIPARLRLYEELRRERTHKIQLGSRANGEVYRSQDLSLQQRAEYFNKRYVDDWLWDYDAAAVAREALAKLA